MSRLIQATAHFGVMKSTENQEEPIITVSPEPFSGPAFDDYRWYRVSVRLPVQPDVAGAMTTGEPEEIKEDPRGEQG